MQRQIDAVVDFIINDLQGKKVSKDYCLNFLENLQGHVMVFN